MSLHNLVLLLTALAVALMAGLFFNWTTAITIGLGHLPDREFVAAMQAINRVIQNPLFFLAFFGSAVLLPVCSYMHYQTPLSTKGWYLIGATVLYLLGVMAVTIFGNVPLNNALDQFDLNTAEAAEITRQRLAFEGKWNMLNTIRTISSTLSLILVLLACMQREP